MAMRRAPMRRMVSSRRISSCGFAAVRHGDHDVVGVNHAEVAVDGLGRVEEDRPACRCSTASPRSCGR